LCHGCGENESVHIHVHMRFKKKEKATTKFLIVKKKKIENIKPP
jgi:hypothetical protein